MIVLLVFSKIVSSAARATRPSRSMFVRSCARLAAASFLLLSFSACRPSSRDQPPHAEGGKGWLVTLLQKDEWRFEAVGDGERMWAWRWGRPGLFVVGRSGRFEGPSLPAVHIRSLASLGDKNHAVIFAARPQFPNDPDAAVYIVGTNRVETTENLVPRGFKPTSVIVSEEGVWITASRGASLEAFVFFVPRGQGTLRGPWSRRVPSSLRVAGSYLVSVATEYTPGGVEVQIYDSSRDPVHFLLAPGRLSPYFIASMQVADGYIWLAGRHLDGVTRTDLSKAVAEGERYIPLQFLHGEIFFLSAAGPRVAWAISIWIPPEMSPTPVYVIDLSQDEQTAVPEPIEALRDLMVDGLIALDEQSCLALVGPDIYYATRSREITKLSTESLGRREVGRPLFEKRHTTGTHIVVQTKTGIFDFDNDAKKLKTLVKNSNIHAGRDLPSVYPDGTRLWLANPQSGASPHGIALFDMTSGSILNDKNPLLDFERVPPNVFPFGDGKTAVASGSAGTFLIAFDQSSVPIELILGATRLDVSGHTPRRIVFDPNVPANGTAAFRMGPSAKLHEKAQLKLVISDDRGATLVMDSVKDKVSEEYLLRPREYSKVPFRSDSDLHIEVTLTDPLGTRLSWNWSGISYRLPEPLIRTKWFRSVLLFVVVLIVVLIGGALRGGLQRWAPIILYVIGGGAGAVSGIMEKIDAPVFLGLMAVAFLAATLSGIVSPAVFRELERVEPFRSLAAWAVSLPSMRRRLYADYISRVAANIALARRQTRLEEYSPVPINVLDARKVQIDESVAPAMALLAPLGHPDEKNRGHVLIESTGGRGKSALVRQINVTALEAFARDPHHPLPIVCEGEKPTLFERAREALGTEGFSDELLHALMRSGEFFLVVDGLTESGVKPEMLREHAARYDTTCPLLLAGRPNKSLRDVVERTRAWVVVEPRWLDDSSLPAFLEAYGRTNDDFLEPARTLCRHEGDKYLPILVRLAILPPPGNEPRSVGDIYRNAFDELIGTSDSTLYQQAIAICMKTYWVDGQRQLAYAANIEDRPALKGLLDAGVLIPADISHAESTDLRSVKFFHDTMQSYLTAVGLAQMTGKWSAVLERAAGAEPFVRDKSDLGGDEGSELFQMCVHVFAPLPSLRERLQRDLLDYAERWGGALSRDWVVEAAGIAELESSIRPRTGGGDALEQAVRLTATKEDVRPLASLYGKTVRYLWPKIEDGRAQNGDSATDAH